MKDPVYPTLTPPLKFNNVQPNLFRGSYPRPVNYNYLESLNLKTMIAILEHPVTETSDPDLIQFVNSHGINLINIECGNGGKGKKRSIPIDSDTIKKILTMAIDAEHSPMYIFCINGGQITSLVVSCLRKISFWSSISIFNEFINYSTTINHNDRVFIENFQGEIIIPHNKLPWLWKGLNKNVIDHHPSLKFKELI